MVVHIGPWLEPGAEGEEAEGEEAPRASWGARLGGLISSRLRKPAAAVEENIYRSAECTIDPHLLDSLSEQVRAAQASAVEKAWPVDWPVLANLRRESEEARAAGDPRGALRCLGEAITMLAHRRPHPPQGPGAAAAKSAGTTGHRPPPGTRPLCPNPGPRPPAPARPARRPPSTTSPLVPPLHLSVVARLDGLDHVDALYEGRAEGFIYARDGHPNASQLAEKVAALEGAASALVCASGMAAESAALLALLDGGDHVALSEGVYGKTAVLLGRELAPVRRPDKPLRPDPPRDPAVGPRPPDPRGLRRDPLEPPPPPGRP